MSKLQKYIAFSLPRFIRTERLWHLPVDVLIGSKLVPTNNDGNMIYDVLMLKADEYQRAKCYLATPDMNNIALEMQKIAPSYIPLDAVEYSVPDGKDARATVVAYFKKRFCLEDFLPDDTAGRT